MECNDFHKIKYDTLQLASTSVCTPPPTHTLTHVHTLTPRVTLLLLVTNKHKAE
jgi:hypothetical protein